MAIYCSYHPAKPADYECPKCGANLCSDCIIKRKNERYGLITNVFLCPKCNVIAKELSIAHNIEPFWNRLPQFFKYPISLQPMMMIFIVSLISSLFSKPSFFSALLQFACFGAVLTYSYSALNSTVHGNLKAPPINLETISNDFSIVFKQSFIYIFIAILVIYITLRISPLLGLVFLVISVLLLPAMIIMLAVTKSFFSAIMPHVFFRLAWRIGWPYLILFLFLVFLISAPTVILGLIRNVVPNFITTFFAMFFTSYYMIVSYHLMGYILFQYHEQVGYDIHYQREDTEVSLAKPSLYTAETANRQIENEMLSRLNVMIKEGNYDEAIALIQHNTGGNISDSVIAERYFNLLQMKDMKPEMVEFGINYLPLLSKINQKDKLCEVYLLCQSIDKNFIDNVDAPLLYKIAKILNEKNNYEEAKQAFERFIAFDENNAMVPDAQFFIAKILNEKLNEPMQAADIINNILKKYPFHENTSFIQGYLRQIKT